MSRTRFDDMECSLARTLDRVGDWWTLLIVREAFYGTNRFSEFQERLGIARNILTERLVHLVDAEILIKEDDPEDARRTLYRLTERGADLFPILIALMQWGDKWLAGEGNEPVRVTDRKTGKAVAPVQVRSKSGEPLRLKDTAFEMGPGAGPYTKSRFAELKGRKA